MSSRKARSTPSGSRKLGSPPSSRLSRRCRLGGDPGRGDTGIAAQSADTLKLMLDGLVAGSVVTLDAGTAELRDGNEKLIGTYGDAKTAISAFEASMESSEIDLDLMA